MTCTSKVLIIVSGASFFLESYLLAHSIKWQSEILSKNDNAELPRNVRQMGSPGRTDPREFKAGMIFSALGYVLLVVDYLRP